MSDSGTSGAEDARRHAPAAERNREPILAVLRRHLPAEGLVLEVASGTGQHAVHFAAALPGLAFQPSDPDPSARGSIDAWAAASGLPNLRPALDLDAGARAWPALRAEAVLCINMIHISPWTATLGLLAGSARVLPPGGVLLLYGPYRRDDVETAPGNEEFDRSLRLRNPAWGLRRLEDVTAEAARQGLRRVEVADMPANNLCVVFRREGA
jgi:SAM-dependent methyltransferase